MRNGRRLAIALSCVVALGIGGSYAQDPTPVAATTTHALSLFGDVKYPADFEAFDYVNRDAPKGGRVRQASVGTFDNLNPFIPKGSAAAGSDNLIYDTLLASSLDEPSTAYGLLAESVTVPNDFSWAEFRLCAGARWHDNMPVTADDVAFSLDILKEKGQPYFRFYYANVVEAKVVDARTVRFVFDGPGNRELPLIMGQLPILPMHYWMGSNGNGVARDFSKTTLVPPLGSGPYKLGKIDPGRVITYERVKDYWGKNLPVNRGQHNFDQIVYEYFRDSDIALRGLFANAYDFRSENSSKNWATAYDDVPAVVEKKIIRQMATTLNAAPMQAFFFNLRRKKFQDARVREAFDLAFDFKWANDNLFYGQYQRTESYFQSSELAATGLPSEAELEILNPYRDQLPAALFERPYASPVSDGSGIDRANLLKAKELFEAAGWKIINEKLTHEATGEIMRVEFLEDRRTFEKLLGFYRRNLKKLGVQTSIRIVDSTQYENRFENFDFDIVITGRQQSLSPGNEQRDYWGSDAADRPYSRNVGGIKNPVVDAIIERIVFAKDRNGLIAASRALDRVLLWNHYVVPQWFSPSLRLAMWDRFGRPEDLPAFSPGCPTIWWYDAAKAAALDPPT
jgi:microcin C transport system substrate-binding protein